MVFIVESLFKRKSRDSTAGYSSNIPHPISKMDSEYDSRSVGTYEGVVPPSLLVARSSRIFSADLAGTAHMETHVLCCTLQHELYRYILIKYGVIRYPCSTL